LINNVDIKLYIIDNDLVARVNQSNNTHWLLLESTEGGFKVYNYNKRTTHYVIVNNSNKPVNCGCKYNIFNDDDVCKHRLVVGKYINSSGDELKVINSTPER
jgi:hypothetical protein